MRIVKVDTIKVDRYLFVEITTDNDIVGLG